MKIRHLLIGLFAVAATVACDQELVETPSLEVSQESLELAAKAGEASFDVTANLAWTATADQDWVNLEPASGDASKDAVKVTVTADDNATNEARTATVTVTAGELTKTVALTQAAAEAEDPGEGPGEGPGDEPVVPEVTELYVLGAACDTGWGLDQMTAFQLVEGVWVWEGNLKVDDFRFPLQKQSNVWWPCLVPTTEGKVVYATDDNQVENPYRVESEGYYKVTVNVEEMTVTFERLSDRVEPSLVVTELYMLGDACDTGWDLAAMTAFENNNGVFTWTGHLKANSRYRFPLQKVENGWWPCLVLSADGTTLSLGQGDADDTSYLLPQSGIYTLTFNLANWDNRSFTIELVEADPETEASYTVAGTIEGDNWNNAGVGLMTLEGDYYVAKNLPLTWSSILYTDNAGRDFFEFKICETGSWTAYCAEQADVQQSANVAINVSIAGNNVCVAAPVGNYDIYFDKANGQVWVMKAGYKPGDEVPEDEPGQPEITYTVTGGIDGEGNHWNNAAAIGLMTQEGEYLVAKNIPFKVRGDLYEDSPGQNWFEFKICHTGTWDAYAKTQNGVMDKANVAVDVVAMSGENINIQAPSGNYDVYFDKANSKVWVMKAGYKPGDEVPEDEQPNPDYQVSELYVLGGACDTGWDLTMMVPFVKEGDVWVWEGNLKTVDAFRFPLQKAPNTWWPCLVPTADGTAVILQGNDPNSAYRVESDGYYKLTVTPLTGALSVERLGDLRAPSFIRELYVIGTGAKVQGWNVPITNPEAKFTNNNDGTFTWVGELVANEEFRFNTQPFDWGPSLSYVEDGKLKYPGDTNMKVAEGGIYTIVVDVTDHNNITYTLTKHEEPEPEPAAATIASVLALGKDATVPADTFVEGVVISNLDINNLTSKKGMYIQDETAGLQFYLAANHTFKFGDKVKVDLSGAKIGAYNGAIQISGLALAKIELLSSGNVVEPKTVTIADFLANKYEGQYVAIENVQVAKADLSKTFVMGGAHTSIKIEDADGKNFVVFSSKYATYGTTAVPQGSGTLKGISSINNGNMQLIFAQTSDFAGLTGERFGEEVVEPENPGTPETPVAANRADFESLTRTSSYVANTTEAGWVLTNCAVQEGHTSDINPQYILIGKIEGTDTWAKAACMNGKTSAVGSIESPALAGGCGTLEFDFAHIFSDKNGMDFNIDVIQNNEVVKTIHVTRTATEAAKMTKLHFSEEVNVSGTFKLKFTNNCPTKKDGNADRVSIWNLTWTSFE